MAFEFQKEKIEKRDLIDFAVLIFLIIILLFLLSHFLFSSKEKREIFYPLIYKKIVVDFSVFQKEKFSKISSPQEIKIPPVSPGRDNPFLPYPKKKEEK